MSEYDVISIIPARKESKRVANKNIADVAGQPLIAYSILDSLRSKHIQETYVSTDDEEIAEIANRYGAEVPFLRPKEYARDDSKDYDYLKHFVDWWKCYHDKLFEYLVILRPTTPLRDVKVIDTAIETFMKNEEASSLRSAHELSESPYKMFKLKNGYFDSYMNIKLKDTNLPNQNFPKCFHPNGYVDIIRPENLINILRADVYGLRIMGFITPKSVEIDTIEDLEYANFVFNLLE